MMTAKTSSSSSIAVAANRLVCVAIVLTCALVLITGLCVSEAAAGTLAVRKFRGPRAAKFQDSVEDILRRGHTVIPEARYARAARKAKVRGQKPRDIIKVCKELGADGVVSGSVQKRGARFLVNVTVTDCATGTSIGSAEVKASRPPLIRAQSEKLRGELEPLIAKVGGAPGRDEADEGRAIAQKKPGKEGKNSKDGADAKQAKSGKDGKRGDKGKRGDSDDDDARQSGRKTRVAAAQGSDDDDDRKDRDSEAEVSGEAITTRAAASEVPGIYVSAGLIGVSRSLTFDVRNGFMDPPLGYEGGLVPSVGIAAEIHPFALAGKSGALAKLGITASFAQVLKIESTLEYQVGGGAVMQATLPTSQSRLALGLLYRHTLASGLSLFGALDYSRMLFEVDRSAAPDGVVVDIPNVVYQSLNPAIGGRYPINAKLGIGAELRVMLMLDAGELQEADQYGVATALGFEGLAHIDYLLLPRLVLRGGLGLTRIGFSFEGTGAQTTNRDGDAATQDVLGATDQYLQLSLAAGYTF